MESQASGSNIQGAAGPSPGPSPSPSPTPALPRRSSREIRDSQASAATNASSSSHISHNNEESIAFATADHGVVSVNLADLSSALGVRRADVFSQRFVFQASSAPARRIDRSLLGSACGGDGRGGGGGLLSSISSTAHGTQGDGARLGAASAATDAASFATGDGAAATPPPVPYQRRHSVLRGQQLSSEPLAVPLSSPSAAGAPPLHVAASLGARPPVPRRGTPPPPGGANALRRALAGDRSVGFAAGSSVPSPLRLHGGLLRHPGRQPSNISGHSAAGASGGEVLNSEEDNEGSERTALLPPPHLGGLARVLVGTPSSVSSAPRGLRNASSPLSPPPPPVAAGAGADLTSASHRSTDASPAAALPLLHVDDCGREAATSTTGAATGAAAVSPSRSVHFSENVVQSVHPAPGEDEYMRLLVIYCRPWYAYVLMVVFGFLLGLSFLSVLYLEQGQTALKDRVTSVPFMLFIHALAGAVGLLGHLALVWRPDNEEERAFFESAEQRGRLPGLWTLGLLFMAGLTSSLVCSHAISSTMAAIMVVALVSHISIELLRGGSSSSSGGGGDGECVTRWDAAGCVLAIVGIVLITANGVMEEVLEQHGTLQDALLVLLAWGVSVLVAGVCWTLFTRQLRDMSQRVSQHFLLSTSLAVSAVVLGVSTYVASVLLSSDAAFELAETGVDSVRGVRPLSSPRPPQLLPCYSLFPDAVVCVGGAVCFLLSWYAYHTVSFYVDHIAAAACMIIGTALSFSPLVVSLALHTWPPSEPQLWAVMLVLAVSGMAALSAGAVLVVCSGLMFRREVEIRVVVE